MLGDLVSGLQNDVRIEIKFILVILAAAQPFVPLVSDQEAEHMEVRQMLLHTFQPRQWRGTVCVGHRFIGPLDICRASWNVPASLEVRDSREDVLRLLRLVTGLVFEPSALD